MQKTLQNSISEMLDQMELLILRSGIHKVQFKSVKGRISLCKDLKQFHDDLQDLMGLQWKRAYNIWVQPSISNPEKAQEVWDRYDYLEITDQPEQKLLVEALKELNTAFRSLVKCLPRKKSVSQK